MTTLTDNITVDVQQGEVVVEDVDFRILSDNLITFEIDCKSKYAVHDMSGYDDDNGFIMYLSADDRTLHTDDSKKGELTAITFTLPEDSKWEFMADGGRYSWTVVAYKRDDTIEHTSLYSKAP